MSTPVLKALTLPFAIKQREGNLIRALGLFFGVSVLLLSGCSPSVEQQQEDQPASLQQPAVPPRVSLNEVMVGLVDHSAHALWDVGTAVPQNDTEWQELEHHAIQLAAAAAVIPLGGTGELDAEWVQQPDWQQHSQQLMDVALAALNEVRNRNVEGILMAGDQLVTTCESCHDEFKPDAPTEGIYHPH